MYMYVNDAGDLVALIVLTYENVKANVLKYRNEIYIITQTIVCPSIF